MNKLSRDEHTLNRLKKTKLYRRILTAHPDAALDAAIKLAREQNVSLDLIVDATGLVDRIRGVAA